MNLAETAVALARLGRLWDPNSTADPRRIPIFVHIARENARRSLAMRDGAQ